jgi:hypothetical protein
VSGKRLMLVDLVAVSCVAHPEVPRWRHAANYGNSF